MAAGKISSQLAIDFDTSVRRRGDGYYRYGSVRIVRGSDREVVARVQGSRPYQVRLLWEEDYRLRLFCDCPYYQSSGPCKHLWAAILAAEAHGYLGAARSGRELIPFFDGNEWDENDGEKLPAPPPPRPVERVEWRERLATIGGMRRTEHESGGEWRAGRQIVYIVDVAATLHAGDLTVEWMVRDLRRDGDWGKVRDLRLSRRQIPKLPEAADREILALLLGARQSYLDYSPLSRYGVPHPLAGLVVPLMARTGRLGLRWPGGVEFAPVTWDEGGAWRFALEMRRGEKNRWVAGGVLRRGEERMDLATPVLVTAGGLVFTRERVAPLAEDTPFEWVTYLRKVGPLDAPENDGEQMMAALLEAPQAPEVEAPEELRFEVTPGTPRPGLRIRSPRQRYLRPLHLEGELWFEYEGRAVTAGEGARGFLQASRRFVVRDRPAESAAARRLEELGLRAQGAVWEVPQKKLPGVARALLETGWHVEAEGKTFRHPGAGRLNITSGVDWFELHGEVQYGETTAQLPELLEALRRGENLVRLGDGTYGLLPEEWLARLGPLAGLGTAIGDHLRFRRTQAGLLDALLAAEPETRCDETFERAREQLRLFEGVRAAEQPAGFVGRLREYQREGLGWMHFLREFGFGGCLADDMGVGKTAQVLALLETRREARAGPSLVVVPKSLVFNWKLEAERFTPQLRVLDYTGVGRREHQLSDYDVIVTTYGTLRRDVLEFKDREFDTIVLDEAQCVKNSGTESAKAVRLLRGRQRLAMSGTPVENHLGELWSLFEFLNPGMLGSARVFQAAGGGLRNPSEETRGLLAQALRPFLLRRTKEQVAAELPPKLEQTLYCELEPQQRRLYNELRAHYRSTLLQRVEAQGLAKSKIHVLEALLRLRQVACHPGLVDAKRIGEPSAKVDVLLEHLSEVIEEGHKALVYSQFTSFLKIVRERLDKDGITYEYLDGKTTDRQSRVERFQSDAACPLFLISLKAGGLGLNLTAAGYVFLLDPWWNPAVEAQAVDRAHRIGQTQHVFAYRLIARDTVEEKVLELQKTKRDLAAAILGEDSSLIRDLRREDLELLLS
jgi:superfamily II DNA or RNA helicase